MDNHTQYSGFAGVDLAKKVMQIHFVTEDGEITDKKSRVSRFLQKPWKMLDRYGSLRFFTRLG